MGSSADSGLGQFSLSPFFISGSQSSPSSAKKQKTFHTPGSAKPKQTLLKPHESILNVSKKLQSPFSSQGAKEKIGKNGSILNFFKPVLVDAGGRDDGGGNGLDGKDPVEVGAKNDDLFIKHGGYDLDVSDPEDEGEGDSWSQEPKIAGRPDFIDELSAVEKDFCIGLEVQVALGEQESSPDSTIELGEGVVLKKGTGTKECTPPPPSLRGQTPVCAALPETPPPMPNTPAGMTLDPGSLKLDRGRSMLFSRKGSTPSPFRGLRKRPWAGVDCLDALDDESFAEGSNDLAWELMLEKAKNEVFHAPEDKGSQFIGEASTEIDGLLPNRSQKGDSTLVDDFENIGDFEEVGFEENEDRHPFDPVSRTIEQGFQDLDGLSPEEIRIIMEPDKDKNRDMSRGEAIMHCPICAVEITNLSEQDANVHVNGCIDGRPVPLPVSKLSVQAPAVSPFFSKGPTHISKIPETPSAFSKIMSRNIESQAWTSAVKSEMGPRGKRGAQKICPFYKILFGGSITVDAFNYGSVPRCQAYFLSHFHSDHYIGLTSKWNHGPIWCSRATANLVRMKLRVDPQYVREFPFEEWTDVVDGIRVRGLDANHCPGSMLFLFEQDWVGRLGKQRILHCGDFRASAKHLNHPLLRPGKDGVNGQKLDSVYLDTTYLNPKYAFPNQKSVIKACEGLCVGLNSESIDGQRGAFAREATLKNGMRGFVRGGEVNGKGKGKLLVVVGTYSIGKEKVCLGKSFILDDKLYWILWH